VKVSAEEARRIAVRAQLLDGTAGGVLETVRRLGFLLPLVRARIRDFRRSRRTKSQRWVNEFLTENAAFKRYVLRELERNGPLLSRQLEDRSKGEREPHRWWGARRVGLMLLSLTSTARSPSSGGGAASASGTSPRAGGPRRRRCRSATRGGSGSSVASARRASGS